MHSENRCPSNVSKIPRASAEVGPTETMKMESSFVDSMAMANQKEDFESHVDFATLRKVHISGSSINSESLAMLLDKLKSIEFLELHVENLLGSVDDFRALQSAIKNLSFLKKFVLKELASYEVERGFKLLIEGLCSLSNLDCLVLEASKTSNLRFPGNSLVPMGKVPCIRELRVSFFHFKAIDLSMLAYTLSKAPITTLSLAHSFLDDSDMMEIANSLENSKLQRLDLSSNDFTDAGIKHLAKSLQKNKTVQTLNLTGCHLVGLEGCKTMADMSRQNPVMLFWVPPFISGQRYTGPPMMRLSERSAKAA